MNRAALAEHALAWQFLSRVFGESPSAAFLQRLAAEDLWNEWPLQAASDDMLTGLRLMREFSATWQKPRLPPLEADYIRLFVGPGMPLAPPWESYYLNRDHLLFQKETLEVREFYRRFGLQVPKLHAEPDDHLGLEMAFVSHLCQFAQESPEEGLAALREFLGAHLLRWAPSCLKLVLDHAAQTHYRAAAHLGLGCLAETASALEVGFLG